MTYNDILENLPKTNTYSIWTNGEDILCETKEKAETIADFIEQLGVVTNANTGYFDPEEDIRTEEMDKCTGWYYVH